VNFPAQVGSGCVAGGTKKRVGGRTMDASLLPQSAISLARPGSDAAAYGSNSTYGSGGRTGVGYPSQINYSALSVQTNTLPAGHPVVGARMGSTQPSQLNFALQVHPSNIPSSHSSAGTRTGATQRPQVDFSSINNDRLIRID